MSTFSSQKKTLRFPENKKRVRRKKVLDLPFFRKVEFISEYRAQYTRYFGGVSRAYTLRTPISTVLPFFRYIGIHFFAYRTFSLLECPNSCSNSRAFSISSRLLEALNTRSNCALTPLRPPRRMLLVISFEKDGLLNG